ncbi:hypothetical protein HMPREF9395_1827 [Streptococcus sanguinis SK1058]|jgi:hypothetical protein|nr:hypothetical protein [Streptococcus sanguinis]EGF20887.1 hypothetical protein HMPREF9395_1827 [Streptococcus sanguinis SK1058]
MIIIDYSPINNSDFYKSFLIELIFALPVLIAWIFLTGEMRQLNLLVIYFMTAHIVAMALAFLLFQKKAESIFLQLIPTGSCILLHFEILFWCSIFFEKSYLMVFLLFVLASASHQLINFIYQILIVSKVEHLEFNLRNNVLQAPNSILAIVSAAIGIVSYLFKLPTAYAIISLVGINIVFFQPLLLNYTRVFTGWRKQEVNIKKSGVE